MPCSDVLPYLRAIEPEWAKAATAEALHELDEQLAARLRAVRSDVCAVRVVLRDVLRPALGGRLPRDDQRALRILDELSNAQSGAGLARLARAEGVEPDELATAVAAVERLKQLADSAETLAAMKEYLDGAVIPLHQRSLAATKGLIAEQLVLTNLARNPCLANGLMRQFQDFEAAYTRLYATWHQRVNQARRGLRQRLEGFAPVLDALDRMNRVSPLGPPTNGDANARHEALSESTRPCRAGGPIPPVGAPVCRVCEMRLGEEPPAAAVDVLEQELERAYGERAEALAGSLTDEVLARDGDGSLAAVREALAGSCAAEVAAALADDVVAHICEVLEE